MNSAILKELRELVKANVISQETADKIETFYQQKKVESNRFPIILSILGSLLVGSGIILVVAHNWDQFSHPIKTILAFLPLVLSQLLCFYVILKKKDSIAWKESSATFLFLSVGACISLISQIYHISGSLSSFLLTWMLLIIPLVYLLTSFVVALLYIGGITWYACLVGYGYPATVPYWYLALLLLLVPSYLRMMKLNPGGNALHIFNWFIAFSFLCCLGALALPGENAELIYTGYLGLCCFYYLLGTSNRFSETRIMANPFFTLGLGGILFILYSWSFQWLWREASIRNTPSVLFASPFPYFTVLFFLLIMYFLAIRYKQEGWKSLDPVGISAYTFTIAVLLIRNSPQIGVLLINLWLLLIALYYINKGNQRAHLGILNFGLLIITVLALFRFFDDTIPFVWRGMIFLLTGVGIFVANFIIIKRKKATRERVAPK